MESLTKAFNRRLRKGKPARRWVRKQKKVINIKPTLELCLASMAWKSLPTLLYGVTPSYYQAVIGVRGHLSPRKSFCCPQTESTAFSTRQTCTECLLCCSELFESRPIFQRWSMLQDSLGRCLKVPGSTAAD